MLGVSAEYALTDDDAVFSALWDKHVSMLNNGKVAYYLPPGLGELLSRDGHLFRISQSLRLVISLQKPLHFLTNGTASVFTSMFLHTVILKVEASALDRSLTMTIGSKSRH
jgi:hypothetical protein